VFVPFAVVLVFRINGIETNVKRCSRRHTRSFGSEWNAELEPERVTRQSRMSNAVKT
jgi:hypothetical protein